jgi:hypothetical protein
MLLAVPVAVISNLLKNWRCITRASLKLENVLLCLLWLLWYASHRFLRLITWFWKCDYCRSHFTGWSSAILLPIILNPAWREIQWHNFCDSTAQIGPRLPSFEVSRSPAIRHTRTYGGTPLNEWSARRRGRYLHNTQRIAMPSAGLAPRSQQSSGRRLRLRLHSQRGRSNGIIFLLFHKILNFVLKLKYAGGRAFLSCTSYKESMYVRKNEPTNKLAEYYVPNQPTL